MQPDKTLIAKVLAEADVAYSLEEASTLGSVVRLEPADAAKALHALRDCSHGYHFLVDLFGIDTGEVVDVVYHLRSFVFDEEIVIKVAHEYGSVLASVWESHPAALMPERECAEMFGLSLAGHPNPKRLLSTENTPPLLLKSTEIRTAEEVRGR